MAPKKATAPATPTTPVVKDNAGTKSSHSQAKAKEQSAMIGFLKYNASNPKAEPSLSSAYKTYQGLSSRADKDAWLASFKKDKTCKFASSFTHLSSNKSSTSSSVVSGLMNRHEHICFASQHNDSFHFFFEHIEQCL